MATECITQVTFKFDPKSKPVVATFDQPHASSDGGAILLMGIDTQFGLTKRLVKPNWVSIPMSRIAPPSELACGWSKVATTGLLFGSNLNVTWVIHSVAIEPPLDRA